MTSEAKRGFIRITSNYIRLFTGVILGLFLVRLILRGTGNDGLGLILLLGSTAGLGMMVEAIVRVSMIRELGAALHSDRDEFVGAYNSAIVLCAVAAILSTGLFVALWFILPLLQIPEILMPAARWTLLAKGAEMIALTLLAAPFNMYKVMEHMIAYNFWRTANRFCYFASAFVLFVILGIDDPGHGIIVYSLLSSGLFIAVQIAAVLVIVARDDRLRPRWRHVDRSHIRSILRTGGWNTAVVTAANLNDRVSAVIMNLAFGLFGNLIFGFALQLTAYVRMLTMGVTDGIEAVSARLSTDGRDDSLLALLHHSTRLHALVTFPASVGVAVLAEPLILVWVGARLQNPEETLAPTVMLIRIMAVGFASMAIAECWKQILYGSGHIARYAPVVIAGGICNPLAAIALLQLLPDPVRYTAVAWAFTITVGISHLVLVPLTGRRALGVSLGQMLMPLLGPLVLAVGCGPILMLGLRWIDEWNLITLAVTGGLYGITYGVLGWFLLVKPAERDRLTRSAKRLLSPRLGAG